MGTDKGDLLVVENGDVRGTLTLDPAGPCPIAAIVATPKVATLTVHAAASAGLLAPVLIPTRSFV